MGIVQLILMIIGLLKQLQNAESKEAFAASAEVQQIGDGRIIEWLWENREELLEFILRIIGMLPSTDPVAVKTFLSK